MSRLAVVLYHYDASPFAMKVKNMLTMKRIPHKRVNVSRTLPRPEISDLLGISYRRIPLLAIGNDVYCDTSLIASVLERRFPPSAGYSSLFPPRKGGGKADTGLVKALSMYWADRAVFPMAAECLPYGKFDANFVADRSAWLGATINVEALNARQPKTKSTLASHLSLLEEQLSDGREWLMDTETPSLADISAHFVFSWARLFKSLRDLYDSKTFPASVAWLGRMTDYLDSLHKANVAAFHDLNGDDAATIICSASHESPETAGFESAEADRLNVKLGEVVGVTPSDNGKIPTIGKLVALNREEVVVETKGSAGTTWCHFPRLNYNVKANSPVLAKL